MVGELPADFQEDIVVRDGDFYVLHPGETVLGITKERLTIPSFMSARAEGKSSLGRRGLGVELAPVIDAGWDDHITVELHNLGFVAIKVRPSFPVCAISFELLTSPALFPYGTGETDRYRGQDLPRY
ncbi:hypothetical protein A2Z23_03470 [Candidatus Curtissbacteria bacterium RBG_16_39_7]|uniref:Uncharacterized protein n=1 Tax=Candidatus Curtissbacteria bacterium RBG_16_39_7 TaxID=1797707 RepID=A0A1F5G4Y0_9BACT|nr:MAG: hypothetical protein A2Z23_03470 [Candidatus Curtissbacteria bacterium RBG_16_39_7]